MPTISSGYRLGKLILDESGCQTYWGERTADSLSVRIRRLSIGVRYRRARLLHEAGRFIGICNSCTGRG